MPASRDLGHLTGAVVDAFSRFRPQRIVLFGSAARGNWDDESDLDVLVVYATDKRFLARLEELYLAWTEPVAIDILAYTPEEFAELSETNAFVQDIVAEGKIIYERSGQGGPALAASGPG